MSSSKDRVVAMRKAVTVLLAMSTLSGCAGMGMVVGSTEFFKEYNERIDKGPRTVERGAAMDRMRMEQK